MQLTGAQILIKTLIEQGVTDVFGYPGGQVINIYDALYEYKDEINHVFDRFYKTDRSRGLDKSGTGLGLYIAKTSIENHGETITVDSVVDSHTEFSFTLPTANAESAPRRIG